ncbi:Hypothetical predicted protein, partial [Prunus dulcis]
KSFEQNPCVEKKDEAHLERQHTNATSERRTNEKKTKRAAGFAARLPKQKSTPPHACRIVSSDLPWLPPTNPTNWFETDWKAESERNVRIERDANGKGQKGNLRENSTKGKIDNSLFLSYSLGTVNRWIRF